MSNDGCPIASGPDCFSKLDSPWGKGAQALSPIGLVCVKVDNIQKLWKTLNFKDLTSQIIQSPP